MEKIVFRVLIITSACSLSEKHVFFSTMWVDWQSAQVYCQTHHTDLTPITNKWEKEAFRRSVGGYNSGWIGRYKQLTTTTTELLEEAEDSDRNSELLNGDDKWKAYWFTNGFSFQSKDSAHNFFCMSLKVEQEEKSWEEAVEHCRESYTDLTSLLSEAEIELALDHLQRYDIEEPVWIGLRYLGDLWLWVNGDPLVYTAWSQNRDASCPNLNRCGALTKDGRWEEKDCLEKLKFICI